MLGDKMPFTLLLDMGFILLIGMILIKAWKLPKR